MVEAIKTTIDSSDQPAQTKSPYWPQHWTDIDFNRLSQAEAIYWNGAMLYLSACRESQWVEFLFEKDWPSKVAKLVADDDARKATEVEADQFSADIGAMKACFERLRNACFDPAGADLTAAVMYLGMMAAQCAGLAAKRANLHSKNEQSRKRTGKRVLEAKNRRKKIQKIWRSGRYTVRDTCAEEEWEALGFPSPRAARECLNGLPAPTVTRQRPTVT